MFFLDLRNFTLLCSRMVTNPREANILDSGLTQYEARLSYLIELTSNLYKEWHACLQAKIEESQIDRYIFQVLGDGAMVAFEGEEHAQAAVSAAVEIGESMSEKITTVINPMLKELGINRYDDLLDFGIGMYSGDFTYVDVPHGRKGVTTDQNIQTILGTAPNYAARIETSNKDHFGTRITIAQTTIDLLCEPLGIDPLDHRIVEDRLGLQYAWKHKFDSVPEIGLYFRPLSGE